MAPRWDDRAAADAVRTWGPAAGEDLARLVYASRLLGSDPSLVLYGGGNTSIKRDGRGPGGRPRRELWIKGSGHDLAGIDPAGFAPLELAPLVELTGLPELDDDALMHALSRAVLQSGAPFPSVESLLHALVDAPVVVHTHADALLVLAAQPEGEARVAAALGSGFAVLPYVRPGHALARAARAAIEAHPDLAGIAFLRHGLFTFGNDARGATVAMLEAVERCTAAAALEPMESGEPAGSPEETARIARQLRGALAVRDGDSVRRVVLSFRGGPAVLDALAAPDLAELAGRGVLTPDHLIRTRNAPLIVAAPAGDEADDAFRARLDAAVEHYRADYAAYVARHATASDVADDGTPRVVLVPGAGLFAAGFSREESEAAATIAERTLHAKRAAERLGRFTALRERDVFEVEYWPPERAKLRRLVRRPLAGRVALVTGGAGAIGAGVAAALAREGALVVLADRPGAEHAARLDDAAARIAAEVPGAALVPCAFDVTDPDDVARAFDHIGCTTGGIDLAVLSHGAALVGEIAALDPARVAAIFDINALGAFHVLGAFVRQARAQRTGGDVVLISTKNVPEPGASFAAYSASKAAAHQLARVAAIELAPDDIRVNLVSPDAVFGDAASPSLLWQTVGTERARSKGIDPATLPEQYRQRNLLKSRVTAEHVAQAVLFFCERRTPTTGAVLPVDGGLPGAFPR